MAGTAMTSPGTERHRALLGTSASSTPPWRYTGALVTLPFVVTAVLLAVSHRTTDARSADRLNLDLLTFALLYLSYGLWLTTLVAVVWRHRRLAWWMLLVPAAGLLLFVGLA